MHCNTALVLSALAIGQAAAASIKHAGFHARRHEQQEKRTNYDVSGVNWNDALKNVDWSSVFAPTPTPAGGAQKSAAGYQAQAQATSAVVAAAAHTSAPAPAAASSASKPQSSSSSSKSDSSVANAVSDAVSLVSKLGVKLGNNKDSQTGDCWIGSDGTWKATFSNTKSNTALLVCWAKNGYDGMSVAVNTPAVTVAIEAGQSQTISFAEGFSGACSPMFTGSTNLNDSMIENTWFEATFKNGGAFDITRIPNMSGDSLAAKGTNSGCTSNMDTCVFKCTDGTNRCYLGNTYNLFPLTNKPTGCNGGYDSGSAGTGGGCEMHVSSEHIQVTIG